MARIALIALGLLGSLATTPVYAQAQPATGTCLGEITKAENLLQALPDGSDRQALIKELDSARTMLIKDNDEKQCLAHMETTRDRMLAAQKRGQSTD